MYHWSTFLVPEDVLMEPVFTGVSQGSIVVPLHFSIFIYDIVKTCLKFAFVLYALD